MLPRGSAPWRRSCVAEALDAEPLGRRSVPVCVATEDRRNELLFFAPGDLNKPAFPRNRSPAFPYGSEAFSTDPFRLLGWVEQHTLVWRFRKNHLFRFYTYESTPGRLRL